MLYAPLEQFQILSLINLKFFNLDFSLTNFLLINLLALTVFRSFIYFNSARTDYLQKTSPFLSANSWQKVVESISEVTTQIMTDLIPSQSEKYFPIISVLFNYILFSNLIGLVPYSFTTTSHLFITFTLSFSLFIGINIVTVQKYKMEIFYLFLPANTSFLLALILVPLEFISHLIKPISLGARLFINLMAGHTLLKVILGFAWSMLLMENFISLGLLLPLITLVILFGLELGVALIQAYVFITLSCIYIQDGG
jgi:F-type H+-transporting ATPase subunit a